MAAVGVASPAQVDESAGRNRQHMNLQQRRAIPKQTLFGTVLDNTHVDSLKGVEGRYMSEGCIKPIPGQSALPQHLKEGTPGQDKVESARHRFLQQQKLFEEADKHLKIKQEQALTFSDVDHWFGNDNVLGSLRAARAAGSTANQMEHMEEYKRRPQMLRNSLLDDTVTMNKVNTLFPIEETTAAYNRNRQNGWRRYQPINYDLIQQSKLGSQQSLCLVELPANIRHKFGSRNCKELLCDKDLVSMSIDRQKSLFRNQRSSKVNNATGLQVNLDGDYETIGQKLRYDIFPGLTTDHTTSQAHQDFGNQVFLRRAKNQDTFHHKRDDLITWSEQNILRERTKKAWDEKFPPEGKKQ